MVRHKIYGVFQVDKSMWLLAAFRRAFSGRRCSRPSPITRPSRLLIASAVGLLSGSFIQAIPPEEPKPRPPSKPESLSPQSLFARVSPSVFVVRATGQDQGEVMQGSAVAVAADRVATNCHVVKYSPRIRVSRGETSWNATLLRADRQHDLCLLDVPGLNARPLPIRKSESLAVGEKVYAIGAPEGLELTLTDGLISSLRYFEEGRIIQTSAPISHGSSGGGLFDVEGKLVGITTFQVKDGQNLNFALPGEWLSGLAAGGHPTAQQESDEALALFARGVKELEQPGRTDQVESAARDFKEAIRLNPGIWGSWAGLGGALNILGRTDESIAALREATRLAPRIAEADYAWCVLSNAYEKAGRFTEALEAAQQALRLNERGSTCWSQLGMVFSDLGRHSEAIDACSRATKLEPGNASGWSNLGMAFRNASRFAEAVEALRTAIRLDPNIADTWYLLGSVYIRLKQYSAASDALETSIRTDPSYVLAWRWLSFAYQNLQQMDKALAAAREAVRLRPNDPIDWYGLGVVYSSRGENEKAREVYKRLKELNSEQAEDFFARYIRP